MFAKTDLAPSNLTKQHDELACLNIVLTSYAGYSYT